MKDSNIKLSVIIPYYNADKWIGRMLDSLLDQDLSYDTYEIIAGRKNISGIIRLELTVECDNIHAKTLYEKQGFSVEGVRPKSMLVNGSYVDEYYMGKILG